MEETEETDLLEYLGLFQTGIQCKQCLLCQEQEEVSTQIDTVGRLEVR